MYVGYACSVLPRRIAKYIVVAGAPYMYVHGYVICTGWSYCLCKSECVVVL